MSNGRVPFREQRQIENEMIFRRANENVGIGLNELNEHYIEDGDSDLVDHSDIVLEFKCECSDETCSKRITLVLSTYQKIHLNRDTFIIKPKHQVESIEEVLMENTHYSIVRKHNNVSDPGRYLNVTSPLA